MGPGRCSGKEFILLGDHSTGPGQCPGGIMITIEGIDGSGKSPAARSLADALGKRAEVLLTKQPGATELGKHLRAILHERTFDVSARAEFLLFAADRAQHIEEVVRPALLAGKIVISDRMADSSRAYQGFGHRLGDEWIERICQWAMQGIAPDLTLYLKTDYATAASRLKRRNEKATLIEQREAAFFERVIEGYETIFRERASVITIDATESEENVHRMMIEQVNQFVQL